MKKLYRSINTQELLKLLHDKHIDGQFDFENADSDYTKDLGKVCCFFTQPIASSPVQYEFFIEIGVDEDEILETGFGQYSSEIDFATGDVRINGEFEEAYLNGYSLDQVENIYRLDDTDMYIPKNNETDSVVEVMEILNISNPYELEINNDNSWAYGICNVDEYILSEVKLQMLYPNFVKSIKKNGMPYYI